MKRGDLVTVALPGDYGKPRPALVIQSDLFDEHRSVTIMPFSREFRDTPLFRLTVEPTPANGLQKASQIMIDNMQTVPREKVGEVFGRLGDDTMVAVNRALLLWVGLA